MKPVIYMMMFCLFLGACSVKKPPLAPTQVVDGKSIVVPPDFDITPTTQEK